MNVHNDAITIIKQCGKWVDRVQLGKILVRQGTNNIIME